MRNSILAAVVSTSAAAFSFHLGASLESGPNGTETVQAKSFEILNDDGKVAARLSSNSNGGTFELYRPGAGGEEAQRFAFIGCNFPGGAEVILTPPQGDAETALWLSVDGKPMSASVVGIASNGKQQFMLKTVADEQPVLTLWNAVKGNVRFEH